MLKSHGGIEWSTQFQLSHYWRNRGILTLDHRNPYDLNAEGILTDAYLNSATIISLVRDPMQRAMSLWKHVTDNLGQSVRPFDAFWLKFPETDEVRAWNAIQKSRKGFSLDFFAPQVNFLSHPDGQLGQIEIFKVEELGRLVQFLEGEFGQDISLPHLNLSRSKAPPTKSIAQEVKLRIRDIYADDYLYLRYAK